MSWRLQTLRLVAGNAARAPAPARCGDCRHFCQAPHEIEAQLPGLKSLGSMFASVRAADGLCRRHERYLGAGSYCDDYAARAPAPTVSAGAAARPHSTR